MSIKGENAPATRLNTVAEIVSYAGVAPFVLCLVGVAMLPAYEQRELAQRIAISYGAVVLAFAGAVHWGLALAGRIAWSPLRIGGAIVPALLGVAATLVGGQKGLALLVGGFGMFWLYEHRSVGAELPAAYVSLRRNLSLAVCTLLAFTMILSDGAGLV
ncbi:MAG: glutaredoxin [Gammaproteobacteria bacterium]|jgi:hypothetical protein|nr:glutaredoxin [Gammaproteobacteria bacterium]